MSKNDLIDMIITERSKKFIYTQEYDESTKEEARELLKNTLPKIKAIPNPLNK